MRITTMLTYKGSETYTRKFDGKESTLYLFENEYGEVDKYPLKEEPNYEIGTQCKVTIEKSGYYSYKLGQRIDRLKCLSAEPLN